MNFRHNDPQTPHERARALAADRLDGPLAGGRRALARGAPRRTATPAGRSRPTSRRTARSSARMPTPEPPRDLWARTSVALERERSASADRRCPSTSQPAHPARGASSGSVVVVLVGSSPAAACLPSGGADVGLGSPGPQPTGGATPLAVAPGDVGWAARWSRRSIHREPRRGRTRSARARLRRPTAPRSTPAPRPSCPLNSRPASIILAPQAEQAAVVESSASTTGRLDPRRPDRSISARRPTPTQTPTATKPATPAARIADHRPPGQSAEASPPPSSERDTRWHRRRRPPPPSRARRPSRRPTAEPTASPSGTPVPSGTPAPTAAATLAIIKDVIVVGGEASYSPDGEWLAFSARPADGSDGPDVYVWHVGDADGSPDHDRPRDDLLGLGRRADPGQPRGQREVGRLRRGVRAPDIAGRRRGTGLGHPRSGDRQAARRPPRRRLAAGRRPRRTVGRLLDRIPRLRCRRPLVAARRWAPRDRPLGRRGRRQGFAERRAEARRRPDPRLGGALGPDRDATWACGPRTRRRWVSAGSTCCRSTGRPDGWTIGGRRLLEDAPALRRVRDRRRPDRLGDAAGPGRGGQSAARCSPGPARMPAGPGASPRPRTSSSFAEVRSAARIGARTCPDAPPSGVVSMRFVMG